MGWASLDRRNWRPSMKSLIVNLIKNELERGIAHPGPSDTIDMGSTWKNIFIVELARTTRGRHKFEMTMEHRTERGEMGLAAGRRRLWRRISCYVELRELCHAALDSTPARESQSNRKHACWKASKTDLPSFPRQSVPTAACAPIS